MEGSEWGRVPYTEGDSGSGNGKSHHWVSWTDKGVERAEGDAASVVVE